MTDEEVHRLLDAPFSPREIILRDGTIGKVRPLVPGDWGPLVEGLKSLSAESRIRRFFFDKRRFSENELQKLTHPDGVDHIAFVFEVPVGDNPKLKPIAVARCFRDPREPSVAEVAVVTRDEWQRCGAATELLRNLSVVAQSVGIRYWFAAVFSEHRVIRDLLNRFGEVYREAPVGSGVTEITYELYKNASIFLDNPARQ